MKTYRWFTKGVENSAINRKFANQDKAPYV